MRAQTAKPIAIWDDAQDVWTRHQEQPTIPTFEHLDVYSETLPHSGMTLNGVAYALPTWAPHTEDTASSSSDDDALLGTPTSRMWKGAGPQGGPTQIRNKARGLIEAQVMDLLPTPAAMDASGGRVSKEMGGTRESGAKRSITLATAVHHQLLPTPSANIAANGGSQHPDKRRAANHQPSIQDVAEHVLLPTPSATLGRAKAGGTHPDRRRATGHQVNLDDIAECVLLPTPRTTDMNSPGIHGTGGQDLRTVVAMDLTTQTDGSGPQRSHLTTPDPSTGDPMSRPSAAGKRSTDTQYPGQLSLLDVLESSD